MTHSNDGRCGILSDAYSLFIHVFLKHVLYYVSGAVLGIETLHSKELYTVKNGVYQNVAAQKSGPLTSTSSVDQENLDMQNLRRSTNLLPQNLH